MSSFQKDIQKAKTSLASIGNVAKDLGQKMSVAITLPIVALGTEIVKTAGNFQSSLNSIGAVLQPTTKEMESLTAKAKELGATTKFSATEAADAILVLGKNGLATNQILGGTLDATLALSSSLKSDLAPTADLLTDVMNQFKISAENVNGSVDDLVGTTIASKFGFEDLKLAYAQAGAVAASVGVDFNDFNAVLAATSSAFASGSDAGTSLKTFLTQLANPTKEAKELMAKLGFTAYDAQGNLLSFAQIEKNLEQSFAGLTEESKAQAAAILFGSDAMRTALTLAETGGKTISDYAAQIDKVNASQVAAAQNKGFEGAIKSLQSAFEALQIAIADTGLLDKVTDMANAMADLLRNMSGLDKSILAAGVAMAAFAAAVGPVLVGFGFLTTTILPLFTAGVGALSAPILVAVAAIAALAAVIYTNWDSIQKQLSELGFLDTVKAAFEDMKNVVVSIFSGLTAILQGLWFVFGKNILSGAVGLLNDLAQIFRSVTGLFSNLVDSVKRLFQGDFKGAFTSLVKSVGSVLDIVVQLGVTAINTVLRLINTFVGSIPIVGDAIRNVMSGVSNFGKSFSDKLDSMGESAKNTAKEISVLKTGIDAANSLGLPTVGNNQGTQAPSLIVKPTKQTETPQLPNVSLNVDGEKKATADLEKEYEKRRRAANEMYNFNVNIAQQMKALTSESILGGLPKIEMPKLEADFGSSVLTQMNAELDLAVQKSLALGDAFNLASAQSSIMQSAISELI